MAWTVAGFHQPVGITNSYAGTPVNGIWNTIKGGQTVPIRFNLYASTGGTELTSVANVLGVALTQLQCTNTAEDPVDLGAIPNTGSTVLRYDGEFFIQNWQTPKGAGRCDRVTMTAADGSKLSAFFKTT